MSHPLDVQLARRVKLWQSRLALLGLAPYTIDSLTITDAPDGYEESAACVHCSADYDRCDFEFRTDVVEKAFETEDFEYLDHTILHEWIHVLFQSQFNVIDLAKDHLPPAALAMWETQLTHEHERIVDRIARQLYAAFKSDVVQ